MLALGIQGNRMNTDEHKMRPKVLRAINREQALGVGNWVCLCSFCITQEIQAPGVSEKGEHTFSF